MKTKLRDYLDLVRLPNLFTAAGDSIAGFLYAGGSPADAKSWLRLGVASMLLYAGGVALNDVCDAAVDATERPTRPIPSGRISKTKALTISIGLLAMGIAISITLSIRCAVIALAIATSIILYDTALKRTSFAPIFMGTCRALNLLLGISFLAPFTDAIWLEPALLMFVYVTSLTLFARTEAAESSRARLIAGSLGVIFSAVALLDLNRQSPPDFIFLSGLLIIALTTWLAFNAANAVKSPTPLSVQGAVKQFVLGILLFDACVVLTRGTMLPAACIAALFVPAVMTARRLRVT